MLRKCPERLLTPSSGEMLTAKQPVKCVSQLCICKRGTTETYLALRHIQKVVLTSVIVTQTVCAACRWFCVAHVLTLL